MGNGGAKMAKEKAIDQKAALEAAYESETVRVLIDKLAPTFMTGLTIDKTVHEFLTATSTAIAEQKGIEKLNGYLDGLGKVDSYLGEQVSIYESHLRLDLKMMYDDMLTKARQKTTKSEMAIMLENPELKDIYIRTNIIEQHLANLKRYADKVKTRMDHLKQIIISKSVAKSRSY
jgi:hypothetical protein